MPSLQGVLQNGIRRCIGEAEFLLPRVCSRAIEALSVQYAAGVDPLTITDVPAQYGAFRVKHGLTIADCYPGPDHVSRSLFWLGDFDPWVGLVLRKLARPGDTVVDIGGNIGIEALTLSLAVGPEGKVFCFEPVPPHATKLRNNLVANQISNVEVMQIAVSDSTQTLHIRVPEGQQGMARVGTASDAGEMYVVQATTFDEFHTAGRLGEIAVCKIDVEGHELSVLKGMRNSLESARVRSIVFEHCVRSTAGDELIDLLRALRYRVFRLHKSLRHTYAAECDVPIDLPPRANPTADFVAVAPDFRFEGTAPPALWRM